MGGPSLDGAGRRPVRGEGARAPRGPYALAAWLACAWAAHAAADATPRPRVVVVSAAQQSEEGVVPALLGLVGPDAEIVVVVATPPEDRGALAPWCLAVARSEAADALVLVERGAEPDAVTVWVARAAPGDESVESVPLREPSAFDRGRAVALAAHALLAPLFAPRPPPPLDAPPQEEDVGIEAAAPAAPDAAGPEAPRPAPSGRAPVTARFALGPSLRGDGPSPALVVRAELVAFDHAFAQVTGELARPEAGRERAHVAAAFGAELSWEWLRGRLGASVGLALGWLEGQDTPALGATLGAVLGLAARLAPELFLELTLGVDGALARERAEALPDVEPWVGLLVGIEPAL
ncbi:MAG: hypothetical protein KF729_34760 [Sandaracinaceae bacterium]|nr:hypothetical protein [Sandaracinaceae bacterium]